MYICNENIINLLDKYIYNYINNNNKIKPIFINGYSGSGKTYSVTNILNKYNIDISYYDSFNNFTELENFIYNKNILHFFKKNNKCLLFDNFDNNSLYYNIYTKLYNIIKVKKIFDFPIIFISNSVYKKNIKNIISYCYYLIYNKPTYNELYNYINHNYNISNNNIKNIIFKSNYNIKKCILNLNICNHSNLDNIENYEYNNDIMDIIYKIFLNNYKYNEHDNLINYNFYNNIYNFIINNKFGNYKYKLNIIKKCLDNFIYNNIIEKRIYINKNDELKNYMNMNIICYNLYTKNYKKNEIEFKYTNYFSKHFILLNKLKIIESICIDNNIYFNKFNHLGIILLYQNIQDKKLLKKINKYNLYINE